MDAASVLTSLGGSTGLLVAATYAVVQWRKSRTDKQIRTRAEDSMTVTDASTANAILVRTLQDLRSENKRLTSRVAHLEEQTEDKDRLIRSLRDEVDQMRDRLDEVSRKLQSMEGS